MFLGERDPLIAIPQRTDSRKSNVPQNNSIILDQKEKNYSHIITSPPLHPRLRLRPQHNWYLLPHLEDPISEE